MISPQMGRMAFRIAFMMVSLSGVMLFVLTPGTAEHTISILTLILGATFAGVLALVVRLTS